MIPDAGHQRFQAGSRVVIPQASLSNAPQTPAQATFDRLCKLVLLRIRRLQNSTIILQIRI